VAYGVPTNPGLTKPGNSNIGFSLGNKVKNKVRVRVRVYVVG